MFSRFGVTTKALQQISACLQLQQTRNTYIVKRRFPPAIRPRGFKPRQLKQKQYVYDLVKNTNTERKPDIQVVLLDFVEGVGLKGEVVSVRPNFAKFNLLLPKLAVYASPENIEKYAKAKSDAANKDEASFTAVMTARFLSRAIVAVTMNMDTPWTIEKFHVRAAFRKAGMFVSDQAIELPAKPISGPNPDLEGKVFLVTITVNGLEKAVVRCRIHHWTHDLTRIRLMIPDSNALPVFPEEEEVIKALPYPKQLMSKETATVNP